MNEDLNRIVAAHRAEVHDAPEHLKARWRAAIDEAAALERGRTGRPEPDWHPTSFFWGAAVTAALAVGIAIGVFVSGEDGAVPAGDVPERTVSSALAPALDRGVQAYLRDSGRRLAGFDTGGGDAGLVLQMLEQNRLFEIVAERNGAHELARVLRAFEPALVQLAVADLAPAEAEVLRARLEFRMRAMLTKLSAPPSDETHTT